ncbi:putative F-box/FBD/LRR-repeat protein [Raphanus sativus]|nr:putative F-box/FBD/LRR-repeat protein [Raphanus sativus]
MTTVTVNCLRHCTQVLDLRDSLIFNRLLHLELEVCNSFRSNLLLSLLKYFPYLQSLKLGRTYPKDTENQQYCLGSEPSPVPKWLSFHLEILQWRGYGGTLDEREAAAYILKNAHRLKTATIRLHRTCMDNGQIIMKDLTYMSKASASCQLVIE